MFLPKRQNHKGFPKNHQTKTPQKNTGRNVMQRSAVDLSLQCVILIYSMVLPDEMRKSIALVMCQR